MPSSRSVGLGSVALSTIEVVDLVDEPTGARVTLTADSDEFVLAIPGVSGCLVRTGRGTSTSTIATQALGSAHIAMLDLKYPMAGAAHCAGDHLIVCHLLRAPPGGRWDSTDLEAGQTFVYPPWTGQAAADPEGLRIAMAIVPWSDVEDAAVALGFDPEPAARQHVRPPGASPRLGSVLTTLCNDPVEVGCATAPEVLLEAVVRDLCGHAVDGGRPHRRRWESRDLVREVVATLDGAVDWQVPVLTLCRTVGVSERRLERAFREVCGITPRAFVRHRALEAAHRALDRAEPSSGSVASIAAVHGFGHGGRFAAFHRAVYAEAPSVTLSRPRG